MNHSKKNNIESRISAKMNSAAEEYTSELIESISKSIDLKSRLQVRTEMAFIELITLLGYREDKMWTDSKEDGEMLQKIYDFSVKITEDHLESIKEWEDDGRPNEEDEAELSYFKEWSRYWGLNNNKKWKNNLKKKLSLVMKPQK